MIEAITFGAGNGYTCVTRFQQVAHYRELIDLIVARPGNYTKCAIGTVSLIFAVLMADF